FAVTQLPPGLELRLQLYAVNGRGRSRVTTLDGFTLKAAEKRIGNEPGPAQLEEVSVTPVVGVLIGVVASLLLIGVGIVVCLRSGGQSNPKSEAQTDLVTSSLTVKSSPAAAPARLARPARPAPADEYEPDDRNPDVVPNGHDPEYGAMETTRMLAGHSSAAQCGVASPPAYVSTRLNNGNRQTGEAATPTELALPRATRVARGAPGQHADAAVLYATLSRRRGSATARSALVRTVRPASDQESVV
ncbi:uncharacterized protein LOC119110642, partial [Pollicipes pollicipes]|uniref:uncharacterized protein LOC119110642 n=1 Tax=Pollicipes pollicipes TaxID=41117 RepID=UPI001884A001